MIAAISLLIDRSGSNLGILGSTYYVCTYRPLILADRPGFVEMNGGLIPDLVPIADQVEA